MDDAKVAVNRQREAGERGSKQPQAICRGQHLLDGPTM